MNLKLFILIKGDKILIYIYRAFEVLTKISITGRCTEDRKTSKRSSNDNLIESIKLQVKAQKSHPSINLNPKLSLHIHSH